MVIKRTSYTGDPFSLGGLIGGIGRVVGGAIKGFGKGGIIGGIGGAIGGLKGKTRQPSRAMPGAGPVAIMGGGTNPFAAQPLSRRGLAALPAAPSCPPGHFRKGNTCISQNPLAWFPGGTPAVVPATLPQAPAQGGTMVAPGVALGNGYKLNKSGYWRAADPNNKAAGAVWVEPGTVVVKTRRRNPGNIKATMRGLARVKSTKALASRLAHVSIRKKC